MNRILRQAIHPEATDFDPDTGQVDMIFFTERAVMEELKKGLDDTAVARTLAKACGMIPTVADRDVADFRFRFRFFMGTDEKEKTDETHL